MERELRRYQNLLVCVGTGVISFGIWTLIKAIMTMVIEKDNIIMLTRYLVTSVSDLQLTDAECLALIGVILGIAVAVDLILRLIVGSSARNEGMGKRKGKVRIYLFFAAILAFLTVSSMMSNFRDVKDMIQLAQTLGANTGYSALIDVILDFVVTTFVDITSLVMIIQIFVAAGKVSFYSRRIREAEGKEGLS